MIVSANRGSSSVKLELEKRSYINTGLVGLNGESVVFRYSDDVNLCIDYIKNEINNIRHDKSYTESILLDSFSSSTIKGARTTVENVKWCISSSVTKSDKMVVNVIKCQNYVYNNSITRNNIRFIWEMVIDGVCENESVRGSLCRII